jgi:WD40 repeat protein
LIELSRFSPSGQKLAFAVDKNVAICNVRDGQISQLGTFGDWNGRRDPNYREGVIALAFTPDGAALVAGGNANQTHTRLKFFTLRSQIFDFDSDAFEHGPGYGVVNIAFAPDCGHLATIVHRWAGSGEPLFLWDLRSNVD